MALGSIPPLRQMSTRKISLGVKARKVANPITIMCHFFIFGSLNFLEPSGLVQACNGIALPLYFD